MLPATHLPSLSLRGPSTMTLIELILVKASPERELGPECIKCKMRKDSVWAKWEKDLNSDPTKTKMYFYAYIARTRFL